eukprot:scaffold2905_cov35-Tisochrysis_lutea.AAC.1
MGGAVSDAIGVHANDKAIVGRLTVREVEVGAGAAHSADGHRLQVVVAVTSRRAVAAIACNVDGGAGGESRAARTDPLPARNEANRRVEFDPSNIPVAVGVASPLDEGSHPCPGGKDAVVVCAARVCRGRCGRGLALDVAQADLRLAQPVNATWIAHRPNGGHAVCGREDDPGGDHCAAAPTARAVAGANERGPAKVKIVRVEHFCAVVVGAVWLAVWEDRCPAAVAREEGLDGRQVGLHALPKDVSYEPTALRLLQVGRRGVVHVPHLILVAGRVAQIHVHLLWQPAQVFRRFHLEERERIAP